MFDAVETEVQEFFAGLTKSLGVNSFTIESKRGLSTAEKGLLLILRPHSPKSSDLSIIVFNGIGELIISFGKGGRLEASLPDSNYKGVATLEAQLGGLCKAIILGEIKERVWRKGSKLVRSETLVFFEEAWHRYTFSKGFFLYLFSHPENIIYEPWEQTGQADGLTRH